MPAIRLNGTSIYYETKGKGTAIIFIHSHGLTHRMFQTQMDHFSRSYQVVVCDLRGNGQSGKLHHTPDDIIDMQCLDLIVLMNALNLKEAIFVGVAYGGLIVQHLAAHYTVRVKAVVIVDSYCRNDRSTLIGKLQLVSAHLGWLTDYAPPELLLSSIRGVYRKWELAYREHRRSLADRRAGELYRQRLAASRIDYSAQLADFSMPALCVVGDYAEYCIHCMREVASLISNAQLVIIPDAFDPSNLCQPELFNARIEQFMEAIT
jgi:3-oxoadipate enol-lactonase